MDNKKHSFEQPRGYQTPTNESRVTNTVDGALLAENNQSIAEPQTQSPSQINSMINQITVTNCAEKTNVGATETIKITAEKQNDQ
jgi:hypothetical protein